ncbi:hypothetical protein BGZ98_008270, partial [Dissophora globulifera]
VGNRFLEKRVNIRVEHIKHSKCRDDFLRRVKENAAAKIKAKTDGVKINLKRQPAQPREARFVSSKHNVPTTLNPIPYDNTHFMVKKSGSSKRNKLKIQQDVSITDASIFSQPKNTPATEIISVPTSAPSVTSVATAAPPTTPDTSMSFVTDEGIVTDEAVRVRIAATIVTPDTTASTFEEMSPPSSPCTSHHRFVESLADLDYEENEQLLNDSTKMSMTHYDGFPRPATSSSSTTCTLEATEVEKKQAQSTWNEKQRRQERGMERRDWLALGALTTVTLTVRMWQIHLPGEIVMDEAHVGKAVNGYLTKEFTFDKHPPLGKLLLAGIGSVVADYTGTFPFEDIGDSDYPYNMPFVHMRAAMALMGALCAPIAFVTMKAMGQTTFIASIATILVTFDNALTANNRLMTLEAPLMFFMALSFMSWAMFNRQRTRPFSVIWWTWLMMTGLAVSGAAAVKANGIFTFLTIGFLATGDILNLAISRPVSGIVFGQHLVSRVVMLLLLPIAIYISVFQLHFAVQTHQPSIVRSAQGEYDFDLLSYPFRNMFVRQDPNDRDLEPVWADIVYGSVVQLRSEVRPPTYVHSFQRLWPTGSKQQQVSGYSYPDLNTHWILGKAPPVKDKSTKFEWLMDDKAYGGEIPFRLRYVKHGDVIRLRHMATRRCLHSHDVRTIGQTQRVRYCEVSAYGASGIDGDKNDWWVIEVVDSKKMVRLSKNADIKVKALETTFRLRHYEQRCFLAVTDDELPKDLAGGPGRRELACLKEAKVLPNTVWRITLNDHDFLPMDTDLASYPDFSFWNKLVEIHRAMWKRPRAFEQQPPSPSIHSPPHLWPLASSKTIVNAWRSVLFDKLEQSQEQSSKVLEVRQISLIANQVIWWTGLLGIVIFIVTQIALLLQQKRGYFERDSVHELRQQCLPAASIFFAGWAIQYLPYFVLPAGMSAKNFLTIHHYFPSLYCSILLSCILFSGLLGNAGLAGSRFAYRGAPIGSLHVFWITVSAVAIFAFFKLLPLTYGTTMTPDQYHAVERWMYPSNPTQRPSRLAMDAYHRSLNFSDPSAHQQPPPHWSSLLFSEQGGGHQIQLPKAVPRVRPPVLETAYPHKDAALPMDDIFMTPCQRPPQLWTVNEQKGRPNPYQRQQMQAIFEAMRKEEQEKRQREEEEERMRMDEEEVADVAAEVAAALESRRIQDLQQLQYQRQHQLQQEAYQSRPLQLEQQMSCLKASHEEADSTPDHHHDAAESEDNVDKDDDSYPSEYQEGEKANNGHSAYTAVGSAPVIDAWFEQQLVQRRDSLAISANMIDTSNREADEEPTTEHSKAELELSTDGRVDDLELETIADGPHPESSKPQSPRQEPQKHQKQQRVIPAKSDLLSRLDTNAQLIARQRAVAIFENGVMDSLDM